jgi:hypothetical protein
MGNFPIIQLRGTWQKDGELTIDYIWLVVSTPLKNMKVSWDDDIPNIWKNKKMFQTTNQI